MHKLYNLSKIKQYQNEISYFNTVHVIQVIQIPSILPHHSLPQLLHLERTCIEQKGKEYIKK